MAVHPLQPMVYKSSEVAEPSARSHRKAEICVICVICGYLTLRILSLFDRNEGPRLGTDVISIGANQFVIRTLLLDVRGPPCGSGHYKERGEMRGWDTEKMIGGRTEKISVSKHVFFFFHHRLDLVRNLEKVAIRR